jgi:hypothetical protein
MSNKYGPISHFFVDQTGNNLADAVQASAATDAFGPVSASPTTKYRTTSKVNATTLTKVFAICKGRILIQPMDGSSTKVNLILKPDANYAPLKIKYFIYRGVNKSDLIDDLVLQPKNPSDVNQPYLIQNLWDQFIKFNKITTTPPPNFVAKAIGFDLTNQPASSLIDSYFYRISDGNPDHFYQLPSCQQGDFIGNFIGSLGLDIVIDYGDYQLQNQTEIFKFDLAYARASEYIFDTTTIGSTDPAIVSRYREYIHQFIDPVAFWGSHIGCGKIKLNNTTALSANDQIFQTILKKFQNSTKVYTYVQAEGGRSYNYYDSARTVFGINTTGGSNATNQWPILIEEISLSAAPSGNSTVIPIILQYFTNTSIDNIDKQIVLDVISPNNDTSIYPYLQTINYVAPNPALPPNTLITGNANPINIAFQTNGLKSCATFLMIYCDIKQAFPLANYYDNLWPVNFNINFSLPASSPNLLYWATYDRSRVLNLSPQLNIGASIQNKVVFDTGSNPSITAAPTKKRRLFMAALKRNTTHSPESDKLNIANFNAGVSSTQISLNQYAQNIFNDKDFATYKGQFTDNSNTSNSIVVNALSLIHETDFERKNSFFLLGITEEEYNKLVYNNISVQTTQLLPASAANVFFYLQEVSNPNTNPSVNIAVLTKDFKKYKVGLKYEDSTLSNRPTIVYPTSPANDVFVYTLDGFYFYSKEYADYQTFYKLFAKAKVEFRTKIPVPPSTTPLYNGEFGFDWLRVGDNGEPSYQSTVISGYKRPSIGDTSTEYNNPPLNPATIVSQMAYKALKAEYKPIPTQNLDDQYYVQYLNLFSSLYSNTVTSVPAPPFQAELRVLVTIEETLNKLEFDYDATLFTINTPILSDTQVTTKAESINKTITISCLKDFDGAKQIRVLAYPIGSNNKNDAKLAGIITLNGNDSLIRKDLKMALVSVRTNVSGVIGGLEQGSFSSDEENNLFKALHQVFINPIISTETLSLENDANFSAGGTYILNGVYIDSNGVGLYDYLKNKLISINNRYTNYFTVFAFDIGTQPDSNNNIVVGRVQAIGVHSVILYKSRGFMTLAHESLHGLGLRHTHSDGTVINDTKQKYIYPNGNLDLAHATDNYMSYTGNLRKTLWQWQGKVIFRLLKKS